MSRLLVTRVVGDFFIDDNYQFFTPVDITASILGILILSITVFAIRYANADKAHYKYFIPAFYFKLITVFAFCFFYTVITGGDTVGFWDAGVKLNNLFWESPTGYLKELFSLDPIASIQNNFTIETGFPDASIFEERQSYFVGKIVSLISFFTFKGYYLISFIFATLVFTVSWQFYLEMRKLGVIKERMLVLGIFFLPSLGFWCGGISKDSIVLFSLLLMLTSLIKIFRNTTNRKALHILFILIGVYLILQLRPFVLPPIALGLLAGIVIWLQRRYNFARFERNLIRLGFLTLVGLGLFYVSSTGLIDELAEEALIINNDMMYNKTYGNNRYSIEVTDYSVIGIIRAIPESVIAGMFRPFLWESLSATLILNGLESMLLIFFCGRFFFGGNFRKYVRIIRKNEILVFALIFMLIMAFFAGFTSILFGLLVRMKAPIMLFAILIFGGIQMPAETKAISEENENESTILT